MALHQRNDRGEFVNPAGGGPLPKLKARRGPDGKLVVEGPDDRPPVVEETRADERPPFPDNPSPAPNPHTQII
jgi:hypothetical protein